MTFATGKGLLHMLPAVSMVLSSRLPALIAASNAANSVAFHSPLAGPFVVPTGGKTLILYVGGGSTPTTITVTIAAGTYTATTLSSALNLDAGFAALLTAHAIMNGRHVEIYATTRGVENSLKIGFGTINSILGLVDGRVYTYHELQNINLIIAQHEEFDDHLPQYPAISLSSDVDIPIDEGGELVEYPLQMRLYCIWQQSTAEFDMLYLMLAHYAELITNIFYGHEAQALYGEAVSIRLTRITTTLSPEATASHIRGKAKLDFTITVQENLQDGV